MQSLTLRYSKDGQAIEINGDGFSHPFGTSVNHSGTDGNSEKSKSDIHPDHSSYVAMYRPHIVRYRAVPTADGPRVGLDIAAMIQNGMPPNGGDWKRGRA